VEGEDRAQLQASESALGSEDLAHGGGGLLSTQLQAGRSDDTADGHGAAHGQGAAEAEQEAGS
jgi:hypothetical protein